MSRGRRGAAPRWQGISGQGRAGQGGGFRVLRGERRGEGWLGREEAEGGGGEGGRGEGGGEGGAVGAALGEFGVGVAGEAEDLVGGGAEPGLDGVGGGGGVDLVGDGGGEVVEPGEGVEVSFLGVEDDARGGALADLDDAGEEARVVEELGERGDGHDLRDGAEGVDLRRVAGGEVVEDVGNEVESVGDEVVEAGEGAGGGALDEARVDEGAGEEVGLAGAAAAGGGSGELAEVVGVGVGSPDVAGPEGAAVDVVLEVVADDVCLLEEEAHGVGEAEGVLGRAEGPDSAAAGGELARLHAAGDEDPGEALADEAGDGVAVAVVLVEVGGALGELGREGVGHAGAHVAGDVGDDGARLGREFAEDADDGAEVFEEGALVAVADALEAGVRVVEEGRVELPELARLVAVGPVPVKVHVVLYRVERAEDEVENANVEADLARELPDDGREGARDLAEHGVAEGLVGVGGREVAGEAREELEREGGADLGEAARERRRVRGHLAVGALLLPRRRRPRDGDRRRADVGEELGALRDERIAVAIERVEPAGDRAARADRRALGVAVEAVNGAVVGELCPGAEGVQVAPPAAFGEEELAGDDLEPGRPLLFRVRHRRRQLLPVDPVDRHHLVRVRRQRQRLALPELGDEAVVDLVLAPRRLGPVRPDVARPVVHARHEREPRRLQRRDPQLVPQLPHRRVLHARRRPARRRLGTVVLRRLHAVQRVRAARVRPHLRERDLRLRPLLQQEPPVRPEQHHAERPVHQPHRLAHHELVDVVLVLVTHHLVHVVHHQALVLQHQLVLARALRRPCHHLPFFPHRRRLQ
mmetsp:Transcript_9612/g.30788  ORF Transcript_9612/g.30788 Transcript_9612/m.30788 type:complete len:817 (+) Transcript_9612:244-2694(+)